MEAADVDREEANEVVTALGAVSAAKDLWDFKMAIHSLEKAEEKLRHNRAGRVGKKYTPEVLQRMAAEEIRARIGRAREMHDAELQVNDEMRARGTPYSERMKVVNARKIEWCDAEEARLSKLLRSFRVRPLVEWLGEAEYEAAREMGMAWIIKISFDEIVYG